MAWRSERGDDREAFAVLRMNDLAALEQEAARARLYALVEEAEVAVAGGRVTGAFESMDEAWARYSLERRCSAR